MLENIGNVLGRAVGLDGHISTISEGYAVLLTGTLVVFGWYISSRHQTRSYRRANAHKYILGEDEKLRPLLITFAKKLKDQERLDVGLSPKECSNLQILLSKMEIIATDIRFGYVSEFYLIETQRGLLINIFEQSRHHIQELREARNHFTAYKNFECLYIRLKYRRLSVFQKAIEFILNKPVFRLSYYIFLIKYNLVGLFRSFTGDYKLKNPEDVENAISFFDKISVAVWALMAGAIIMKMV